MTATKATTAADPAPPSSLSSLSSRPNRSSSSSSSSKIGSSTATTAGSEAPGPDSGAAAMAALALASSGGAAVWLEPFPQQEFDGSPAAAGRNPFDCDGWASDRSDDDGGGVAGGPSSPVGERLDGGGSEAADAFPDPPLSLPDDTDSDSDSDSDSISNGDDDDDDDGAETPATVRRSQDPAAGCGTGGNDGRDGRVGPQIPPPPPTQPQSQPQLQPQPSSTLTRNSPSPHLLRRRRIDNTSLTYCPVRLRCGTLVQCRPDVLIRCPHALRSLNADLTACLSVLPRSVHSLVRRTKFWVNLHYSYGWVDEPRRVRHTTAHHHQDWLVGFANDIPEKVRSIEIYDAEEYVRMRCHWNGPGLILHELCHLVHQVALQDGLYNGVVVEMHKRARRGGKYDKVLRRDWAGKMRRKSPASTSPNPTGDCGRDDYIDFDDTDMAYAMVNHKEFFAEMSVTYLAGGYQELDGADPTVMEECCPPLTSLEVIRRMREAYAQRDGSAEDAELRSEGGSASVIFADDAPGGSAAKEIVPYRCCPTSETDSSIARVTGENRRSNSPLGSLLLNLPLLGRAVGHMRRGVPPRQGQHCNKFYPFTRGQLVRYDPGLAAGMAALWHAIACWDGEDDNNINGDAGFGGGSSIGGGGAQDCGGQLACWGWTG